MNFLKNIIIVLVYCVTLIDAKNTGTISTQQDNIPVRQISNIPTQPVQSSWQAHSYAEALQIIRTQMRPNQILNNDLSFTQNFINFVRKSVQNSSHADVFAKALFEAGMSFGLIFTPDNNINMTMISDVNDYINRQMYALFPKSGIKASEHISIQQPQQIQKPTITQQTEGMMHQIFLAPTNMEVLKNYGLCPLFGQQQRILNADEKKLIQQLRSEGNSEQSLMELFGQLKPHYSVFDANYITHSGDKRPQFINRDVAVNVPCIVDLNKFNNCNRKLMQYRTLDQFEFADAKGFSPAMCGGLSLNNGRLIRQYALSENTISLKNMHIFKDAASFLKKLDIKDWINASVLRENIQKLRPELGIDGVDVSAISTVCLFDSLLYEKFGSGLFDKDEFVYVQKVKRTIQEGLKKDNYLHIMVIGNEEAITGAMGHYFCFAIIKSANDIQYIVLDTIPSAYHLQEGSHERDRLMFVIDNIERGHSQIKVANIRMEELKTVEKELQEKKSNKK